MEDRTVISTVWAEAGNPSNKRTFSVNLSSIRQAQKKLSYRTRTSIAIIKRMCLGNQSEALVRKLIHNCRFCKRGQVTPQPPIMNSLPESRLDINVPPFTNTGIDYFQPVTSEWGRCTLSADGTSMRYGAVFTCLSTHFTCLSTSYTTSW